MQALIRGYRAWLIIAALAAAAALAGVFTMPPLDRDESRFAQATAQMMETGDYVRISFLDEPRHKKPVGIHWLQAAAVTALSSPEAREIWVYRLPSVLGAILAALACFWGGARLVGREAAFAGAALFSVTVLLGAEGGIAKTDAMLAGATTLALAALAHLRTGGGRKSALIFWVALGAGVLLKGPVTPMAAALLIVLLLIWERKAAWLKPLGFWPGPVLAALIVLPWLVAIQIATGGAFLTEAFAEDLGPKLVEGHENHGGLPGFHLALLPVLFFPTLLFLAPGVVRTVRAARGKSGAEAALAARFLIAWAVPLWLVFELLPTKLPHYVLPAYPALALIAGWGWTKLKTVGGWSRGISVVLALLALAVLAALIVYLPLEYGGDSANAAALAALVALVALAAMATAVCRRPQAALALTVAAGLGWHLAARGIAAPDAAELRLAERAREAVTRMAAGAGLDAAALPVASSYTEPSLVFVMGTRTLLADWPEVLTAHAGVPRAVIVDSSRLPEGASVDLPGACATERIGGYNYSRGRATRLYVALYGCPEGREQTP